ncbi:FtsK/SpoIIIE domain-containing protein [Nocardioides convexus]|uniref:FtsK/SpoIIIE domain-containing protein n=1 Tax=Nocardioides convexus TaxID=2712224 RepID=UPI0024185620|nr:FtsK/SpoIIIE domain-containing protein [Nocardioides convexus]
MPDLQSHPDLGLVSMQWRQAGNLTIPIGTVDRPREQRRDTLTVSLSGAAGHVAVVGGPRSGKSTLLRTIVTSLSLTSTPLESQFYVLDFGGGTFAPMTALPHVAGVGSRSEPEVVRRILAEVKGIVDRREAYFRTHGIDSIETYRSRRAQGRADDGYGDVFLVVDGWGTLRSDFDDLEVEVQQTRRARTDLRPAHRHRGHPLAGLPGRDARPDRHQVWACASVTPSTPRSTARSRRSSRPTGPGAAWCPAKPALPRRPPAPRQRAGGRHARRRRGRHDLGGREGLARSQRAEAAAAARPDHARPGARPGPDAPGAPACCSRSTRRSLAPVAFDVDAEPHLLLFGDGKSGKSNFLRTYCQEIMRTRTPAEAQIVVVDYRRSLLGEVPEEYLLNYLTSATQAQPALSDLATYLQNRLPGPDVTPDQPAQPVLVVGRGGLRGRRRLRPGRHPAETRRSRCSSRCWPRPATSACTWSSRGAPVVPRGRSTSRSSSRCATSPCPASCWPATATRAS